MDPEDEENNKFVDVKLIENDEYSEDEDGKTKLNLIIKWRISLLHKKIKVEDKDGPRNHGNKI